LVSTDGNIDWFCTPRFDAPSVFASLLDADKGGHFHIQPIGCEYVTRQIYLPDSAVLVTRFMSADGVGEVHDFMPVVTGRATDRHRIVRQIRVNRGTMKFAMELQPRFDYARQGHEVEVTDDGATFRSDGQERTLHTVGSRGDRGLRLRRHGKGPRGWCLSPVAAGHADCRPARSSGCPPTPPRSGGTGWASPPTGAGGGRWSRARP